MAFLKYKHIFRTQKCRFTVSISRPFFSSFSSFQKIPSFPTGFECLQFLHIFGESFLSLPKPPPFQKKKKRSTIDRRRSYKVCVCGRLCYNVLIAATIGGINLKNKSIHPTPPTRCIVWPPSSANALMDGGGYPHTSSSYKKRGETKCMYTSYRFDRHSVSWHSGILAGHPC